MYIKEYKRAYEMLIRDKEKLEHILKSYNNREKDVRKLLANTLSKKMLTTLKTYIKILPKETSEFDISSTAVLTRTLIENYNIFYYLVVDRVDKEEEYLRILICELHYEVEKIKMFLNLDLDKIMLEKQQEKIDSIRSEIRRNSSFRKLRHEKRNQILRGNKALYLTYKEINRKIETDLKSTELDFIYRYTSNFVHTSPFSIEINSSESIAEKYENIAELIEISRKYINFMINNYSKDIN